MRTRLWVLAMMLIMALFLGSFAIGQTPVVSVPKVAVLPLVYTNGTDGAETTAKTTLEKLIRGVGYELIDEGKVNGVWSRQMGQPRDTKTIPADKELLALGEGLGADYVVAGTCGWRVKTIVGFGLKTKALCNVEVRVVRVKTKEVDYTATADADSTKRLKDSEIAGAILFAPIAAFVSGGPKTPHMQRSAQMALLKVLDPWLKRQQEAVKPTKITP